jgi:hypothetical protein
MKPWRETPPSHTNASAAGPVAHGADDLARGEVEHGPVAADEEDGRVLVRVPQQRRQPLRVLPHGLPRLQGTASTRRRI